MSRSIPTLSSRGNPIGSFNKRLPQSSGMQWSECEVRVPVGLGCLPARPLIKTVGRCPLLPCLLFISKCKQRTMSTFLTFWLYPTVRNTFYITMQRIYACMCMCADLCICMYTCVCIYVQTCYVAVQLNQYFRETVLNHTMFNELLYFPSNLVDVF